MDNDGKINEVGDASVETVTDSANTAAALAPPKKRCWLFSSMRRRTLFNLIAFSVGLLLVLWSVFIIFLWGVYSPMLESDFKEVGKDAAAIFTRNAEESKVEHASVMSALARREAVSIAVFTKDGADYSVIYTIDTYGNITDEMTESFEAIMIELDSESVFGTVDAVDFTYTDIGTFMCYGCLSHSSAFPEPVYMLVTKLYEVLNTQTMILIYSLIGCTAVVLAGGIIVAVFMSKRQTKLLMDFSENAKQLADGDYSVEFAGGGYEEYENLAHALNTAKDEMAKTEDMRRDMLANVSHDIRTPLTMIRAYAEMLRDMPVDPEKRKKTAEVIISESDRLDVLAGDVMALSKLQAGVAEFKMELNDVSDIARYVLERFDLFRERDGITFETDFDASATAVCDSARIEQVMYNLIVNAINYCGEDKKVIVRVKNKETCVRVEVSDHGKGIEKSELDSVWDRYYRAARSKRSTVGSGLGLSICKSILTAHGAKFGVESELGNGATFWFELKAE